MAQPAPPPWGLGLMAFQDSLYELRISPRRRSCRVCRSLDGSDLLLRHTKASTGLRRNAANTPATRVRWGSRHPAFDTPGHAGANTVVATWKWAKLSSALDWDALRKIAQDGMRNSTALPSHPQPPSPTSLAWTHQFEPSFKQPVGQINLSANSRSSTVVWCATSSVWACGMT